MTGAAQVPAAAPAAPLTPHGRDAPLLHVHGRMATVGELLARAALLARALEGASACINLCEQREGFLIAWLAALLARRPTLMPPARAPEVVAAVHALHPSAIEVDDATAGRLAPAGSGIEPTAAQLDIAADHLLMIGYTSGSTGVPGAHAKHWGSVQGSSRENAAAIVAALPRSMRDARPSIVGTVPSQHMYGMELTVLLPLLSGWPIHHARPLLPQDVADALADMPAPRVLVSTPAHLRAIVAAGVTLPEVAVTVSATAPLDAGLARQVEAATGGTMLEMFGATETCIFAARRTAHEQDWHAYPGVCLEPGSDGTRVLAPWFRAPQQLQDLIEVPTPGRFRLLGRNSDMVDVAGKRASLADLTARVLAVPGVVDAVVFQPEAGHGLVRRLAALVVAPTLDASQLRAALIPAMDALFLPRPLFIVPALPRTAAGKLPRAALLAELARLSADRHRAC